MLTNRETLFGQQLCCPTQYIYGWDTI
jgi:hypothetical protein